MHCSCRRGFVLGSVALACSPAVAPAQSAAGTHAGLHARLRGADAFDAYLADDLARIVAALARAMAVPGGAALNAVPGPGGIMVCLVRAERERAGRVPMAEIPSELAESPVADTQARVVWIDADFLRLLVMRIALRANTAWGGSGLGSAAAVAQTLLAPPPARPELWQPATSPGITHPTLALTFHGALGFLLAHEFAHMALGPLPPPDPAMAALPRRARQLAPMCPMLTSPSVLARRGYEEQADSMALAAVHAGGDALGRAPAGLPGDLGIATLLTLMLGADLVRLGSVLELPLARRLLELEVGAEDAARLRAQAARPGTDLVRLIYSDTHPAAVQRLLRIMQALAGTPGSLWYGNPDPAGSQALMQRLVERVCTEALQAIAAPR